jgi:hypothetical protein
MCADGGEYHLRNVGQAEDLSFSAIMKKLAA